MPDHEAAVREAVGQLAAALLAAVQANEATSGTPERLLDLATTAERLGVTRSTLYERVLAPGRLRTIRIGRRVLVPESAITEYLARDGR